MWRPAFLRALGLLSIALVAITGSCKEYPFELPVLKYAQNALEPHISEETISYHYGIHHQNYVNNLNTFAEEDSSLVGKNIWEIMMTSEGAVFNNAGQLWNHNFYWRSLSPDGGGEPKGPLMEAIKDSYGSYRNFVAAFDDAAAGHFASGWAWLVKNNNGTVEVQDTHDASNPVVEGTGKPLLVCDVWEHAYYIDYRNGRADYIDAWWNLVNWDFALHMYNRS